MKSQIPSTKLQTNFKFQYQMTETKSGILNFGHCDLFDICDLLFGIFGHSNTPTLQGPSALLGKGVFNFARASELS